MTYLSPLEAIYNRGTMENWNQMSRNDFSYYDHLDEDSKELNQYMSGKPRSELLYSDVDRRREIIPEIRDQ
uniref:Uncharacterized protein n=1 Tax=Romanomermis culicivorax TaxID=13658 RepID=A0A915HM56_ROMCU